MHELDWTHGYAFAFAVTAFTTLITYWYLRRRNWF
jgi:Mg2+ and Co2+ transporter CorA